jgi:hypothetical protein
VAKVFGLAAHRIVIFFGANHDTETLRPVTPDAQVVSRNHHLSLRDVQHHLCRCSVI